MLTRLRNLAFPSFLFLIVFAAAPARGQTALQPGDAIATISPTEARFVFPAGTRRHEGIWSIDWEARFNGRDPYSIWLRFAPWPENASTTAKNLLAGVRIMPMIECMSCDGPAASEDGAVGPTAFRTSVENGRFVLRVVGRGAISHLFPVIPKTVRFDAAESPEVRVNCGAGLSAKNYHLRCIVPPYVPPPDADSAAAVNAPRRVRVLVSDFRDAKLLAHIPLVVRTMSNKPWITLSTDSLGNAVLANPPLWSHLFIEAGCLGLNRARVTRISGTTTVQITPRMDTTVQLMTDPRICAR